MAPAATATESRRGVIEASVKKITDGFVAGKISTPDDRPLTPYICAKLIQQQEGLDKMPSSGSVSAVFDRWKEIGFANFRAEPYSFKDYSAKGRELGLSELKSRHSAKLRKQKAAAEKK